MCGAAAPPRPHRRTSRAAALPRAAPPSRRTPPHRPAGAARVPTSRGPRRSPRERGSRAAHARATRRRGVRAAWQARRTAAPLPHVLPRVHDQADRGDLLRLHVHVPLHRVLREERLPASQRDGVERDGHLQRRVRRAGAARHAEMRREQLLHRRQQTSTIRQVLLVGRRVMAYEPKGRRLRLCPNRVKQFRRHPCPRLHHFGLLAH
mmetsp:Transcript_54946/g.145707  ORF Transcript_54946/g.145707 Transcript_54946/m.145707 type:complete len:207 (+) Transcript_54946:1890-2510(+)